MRRQRAEDPLRCSPTMYLGRGDATWMMPHVSGAARRAAARRIRAIGVKPVCYDDFGITVRYTDFLSPAQHAAVSAIINAARRRPRKAGRFA